MTRLNGRARECWERIEEEEGRVAGGGRTFIPSSGETWSVLVGVFPHTKQGGPARLTQHNIIPLYTKLLVIYIAWMKSHPIVPLQYVLMQQWTILPAHPQSQKSQKKGQSLEDILLRLGLITNVSYKPF